MGDDDGDDDNNVGGGDDDDDDDVGGDGTADSIFRGICLSLKQLSPDPQCIRIMFRNW